jgi:hydroxyacylglutathione hydrolase
MPLTIEAIPCLKNNYAWLICDSSGGTCAVIDPAEAEAVTEAVAARRLKLTHILNTHHHADHTGGNLALKAAYHAKIAGAGRDRARIPGLDIALGEDAAFSLFGRPVRVLETPGHTSGALCFVVGNAVFTGDTLFSLGSGKLFEGDAPTMLASLAKLTALPDQTEVYYGHEYTLSNARFALTLEPNNTAVTARRAAAQKRIDSGQLPAPTTIGIEKNANPFLRAHSATIRAALGMAEAFDVEVFAEIRRRKDAF